jgi:agmatine deiminase
MGTPSRYEKIYEPAFAQFSAIISRYQPLHILVNSGKVKNQALAKLNAVDEQLNFENIIWHPIHNDSAWMRDNGPVYVEEDGQLVIQNWQFDAWGGAFGSDIPFDKDNAVPEKVAAFLNLPIEQVDIVHERGNLEFNGVDTVLLNWSTLGDPDRNLAYTRGQAETDLKQQFGVSTVVFIEGIISGDLTRGHIDGIARFINATTVVVPQCTTDAICGSSNSNDAQVFNAAAEAIEAAGFKVIRDPIEGFVEHRGSQFDATYMNWLVGNGFVITGGFGDEKLDQAAKARLARYFPDRDIYVVEMLDSWYAGGGVHCHTNDQPAI